MKATRFPGVRFESVDHALVRGIKIRHIPMGVSGLDSVRRRNRCMTSKRAVLMAARRHAKIAKAEIHNAAMTGNWHKAKQAVKSAHKLAERAEAFNVVKVLQHV